MRDLLRAVARSGADRSALAARARELAAEAGRDGEHDLARALDILAIELGIAAAAATDTPDLADALDRVRRCLPPAGA